MLRPATRLAKLRRQALLAATIAFVTMLDVRDVLGNRGALLVVAVVAAVVLLAAGAVELFTHGIAPRLFTHYDALPALRSVPRRTENGKHEPGDPVNVALVGTRDEIAGALARAGWVEAEPVTRASSLEIARSVLLDRPDSAAPVSPLFLFGRPQDLAYEREVGRSARRRHHVRLWLAPDSVRDGARPVWIGSATFDRSAGISRRGLHPTHHIDPDVDLERDTLMADLARARQLDTLAHVTGYGVRLDSRNAEGDRFDTDGEMAVGVVPPGNQPVAHAPARLPDPPLVRLKDELYGWVHRH